MTQEKRENWKLGIEVVKLFLQTVGLVAIFFAFLSYRDTIEKGNQDTYRFIATDWNDHLKTFVEHPELRPYFFERAALPKEGRERQIVESLADVRLDKMDAILTYFNQRGASKNDIAGWTVTFDDAFRRSPALCNAISGVEGNYGLIVPIAKRSCR